MELDQQTSELVSRIEYMIGSQCYNPNSYDGFHEVTGRSFRYPVTFSTEASGSEMKTRSRVPSFYADSVTPEMVRTMKYKFGSNELFIGEAIIEVLEMLEGRYSIDINQLETLYRLEHPSDR